MAQLKAGSTAGGSILLTTDDLDTYSGGEVEAEHLLVYEQQKILASDAEASDKFGHSVSISADGRTAIVGAHLEDTGGSNAGAAYIFTSSNGTTWTEQQKIQSADIQAGDEFGAYVSISGDGRTAIVSARFEDTSGTDAGAAYIFTSSNGTTWTQQQKIQSSDIQGDDRFGSSVAMSADGRTAIVGSYLEDTGGSAAGAAYIFTSDGTTWTEQQKIQASDAQLSDFFGHSVFLSADGRTAIVGAILEDTGGSAAGAAYIFTSDGTTWTEQQKIQASDKQASDRFGQSVSMSADGRTAIVGAILEDTGGSDAGAAYIFTSSNGTTWTQQQKIQASDRQASDLFGNSVAISANGRTVIVGSSGEDTGGTDAGAAYIYTSDGSTWTEQQKILTSDAKQDDAAGGSVSISADGRTALVGAPTSFFGNDVGAAYIFNSIKLN